MSHRDQGASPVSGMNKRSAVTKETPKIFAAQGESVLTGLHYFALSFTLLCTRRARHLPPAAWASAVDVLLERCLGTEPQRAMSYSSKSTRQGELSEIVRRVGATFSQSSEGNNSGVT